MKLLETTLSDCCVLEPVVHGDSRGFFLESYNQKVFNMLTKTYYNFVQDNLTSSNYGVLRGLHYQYNFPQAKLVSVVVGEIFDVAVDLRKSSASFGKWFGINLSSENKKQIWIPCGFAHGFQVLSKTAIVQYKTTDFYNSKDEKCIIWNDPDLKIEWPLNIEPILSLKDKSGLAFKHSSHFK